MQDATTCAGSGRRVRLARAYWVRVAVLAATTIVVALRRLLDVVAASTLLLLLSPLLVVLALRAWRRTGRVLDRAPRVGRWQRPFEQLSFAGGCRFGSLPVLINVVRGDLSLTGPRALSPAEAEAQPTGALVRFDVRPGLVSPHTLRLRTGVAYDAESVADQEFVYRQTLRGDLGLVARAIPGALLGGDGGRPAPPTLDLFGITVVNTTMDEAVDWIAARAQSRSPGLVAFVNPDCLNIAYRHEAYRAVLQGAARVLPDGIGIHIGCRLLGSRLRANVNGTDLFPRLCERLAGGETSLYLLGARPGVAAAAAAEMQRRYPGLRVAGARDGYFTADETADVIEAINRSGADVLLVAFGVPRQELWLAEHGDDLRAPVRIGVGGLFDFYSGRIPRAPIWMREIGLEWIWRLAQEPGRMWRRYLVGNPLFLYRVWRQARSSRRATESAG